MPSHADKPSGLTGESHPEVYERLPRSNPLKPGQLTDEQLDAYYRDGYLLVKDFFKPEELDPLRDTINELVDNLADRLFDAGKVKSKYEDLSYLHRLTMLEKDFPGANIILHRTEKIPKSFSNIAENPRMLNLIEDFVGPDIAFNPVWNLRTKTPDSSATVVPWHQDNAYMDNRSYELLMMTAWVPLVDANEKNGTLEFVKGSHSCARVAKHSCCAGPTWYVMLEEEDMEKDLGSNMTTDREIVNVPYGSFILFNNFVAHRSLENKSDGIRWSVDLRWQKAGTSASFYDLKDALPLRMGNDPTFKPDWDSFNSLKEAADEMGRIKKAPSEFSTIISGPWMQKWPIVHENHHTDALNDREAK